ncbi:hypothetical protein [Rosistilla oblonga]|uniref:hypothetical protein n=1 Tax=Rosistilla oblonga TaxID=2527990 RepID=UPI003A96AAE3
METRNEVPWWFQKGSPQNGLRVRAVAGLNRIGIADLPSARGPLGTRLNAASGLVIGLGMAPTVCPNRADSIRIPSRWDAHLQGQVL